MSDQGTLSPIPTSAYAQERFNVPTAFLNGHSPQKSTTKIALLGRAPSSLHLAPFADSEWDIWTLGNAAMQMDAKASGEQKGAVDLPRWNRLFELHDFDEKKGVWPQDYFDWLAKDHGSKQIIISQPHKACPHGTPYPWQEVFDKFGRYFNNSVSEMVALALLEGATHLGLYGVDMAQSDSALHQGNPEYQHQRPSCEYILGVARGMGVDVFIPDASDLLKCPRIYGLQSDIGKNAVKYAARMKELAERQKGMQEKFSFHTGQWREWEKIAAKLLGNLEMLIDGTPEHEAKEKELQNATEQVRNHKHMAREYELNVAKFMGALEDNEYWKQRI